MSLAEIQPARLPTFDEVKDRVKADLVQEQALASARALAAQLLEHARQDGLASAAAALGLAVKQTPTPVSREEAFGELGTSAALESAFALAPEALSEPLRVPAGWAVVRVLEKSPFDPGAFAKEQGALIASLREQRRGQLFQSYLAQARERFAVER